MSSICDVFESPLGAIYLLVRAGELVQVSFERRPPGVKAGAAPLPLKKELEGYFGGTLKRFTYPFSVLKATGFEREVWLALLDIPYGQTRSYKWLSEKVGRPLASRAVGQALSRNPLPIVLPCHRVIESDGRIGGYSSGVEIKRRLLDMEYYYSSAPTP